MYDKDGGENDNGEDFDGDNDHNEDVGNDEDEGQNVNKGEIFKCDDNDGENDDDKGESNVDEEEGVRMKLMVGIKMMMMMIIIIMLKMKVVMMRILNVTDSLSVSPGSRQALRLWSLYRPEEGASHRLLQEPQPQSAQRPHQAKSASACKICRSALFRWNQQHRN